MFASFSFDALESRCGATQGESFDQDNIRQSLSATILVFPCKTPETIHEFVPNVLEDDVLDQRMKAPLTSNEITAIWNMIKYRAKHFGQKPWVATGMFLAAMGVEELGDLCRSDFVHAVEYLVRLEPLLDLSAQTQCAR